MEQYYVERNVLAEETIRLHSQAIHELYAGVRRSYAYIPLAPGASERHPKEGCEGSIEPVGQRFLQWAPLRVKRIRIWMSKWKLTE